MLKGFRLKSRVPSSEYLEVTFQYKVTSGVPNLVYESHGWKLKCFDYGPGYLLQVISIVTPTPYFHRHPYAVS